jgi:hypothetical protein
MINLPTTPVPAPAALAKTTAIALAVATAILFIVVLPAEYAVDPLGTGRMLGLTEMAAPPVGPIEERDQAGAALTPVAKGPIGQYPSDFKLDAFEVTLQPYEYIEYKYHLEQGATMLFAWNATAPVLQDFHGERAGGASSGAPAEETFDKENRRQATGSLTAPFAGIHGWYWENPGNAPVTIRLTSAGFYGSAVEIRSDRTRHPRTLRSLEAVSTAPVPTNGSR